VHIWKKYLCTKTGLKISREERDQLREIDVNQEVILKWVLEKYALYEI
jgi:hypothetical protein